MGDFNLDGRPDVTVAHNSSMGVLLGTGGGTFAAATLYPATQSDAVVVADFNVDGKPDIAVGRGPRLVNVYLGDRLGGFAAPLILNNVGLTNRYLGAGDFNADQRPDLAVVDVFNNVVVILLNTCQ